MRGDFLHVDSLDVVFLHALLEARIAPGERFLGAVENLPFGRDARVLDDPVSPSIVDPGTSRLPPSTNVALPERPIGPPHAGMIQTCRVPVFPAAKAIRLPTCGSFGKSSRPGYEVRRRAHSARRRQVRPFALRGSGPSSPKSRVLQRGGIDGFSESSGMPDPALKDQTIPLAGKEVLIGRGKENGLVLEDNAVSRHHARIVEEPDGHVLIDNNSANGSWVNGQRVTEMRLKPGDQIRRRQVGVRDPGRVRPEGTALLDVQGMGMSMKPAPAPAPASQPHAPAPPPPAPRPSAPSFEPATTPEPVPMRRPAPPPTPIPGPTPVPARTVPMPPPAPVAAPHPAPMPPPAPAQRGARPAPMPPAPMPAAPPPAYIGDEAPIEGEPAGFWIRFAAYLIDSIIISVMMGIIWVPTTFLTMRSAMSESGPGPLAAILPFLAFLLTMAASLGYVLWFWATKGATPGKKMLGLRIVRDDGEEPLGWGTAFMRLIGYMVSGFILYIGFLMIAFNPDKMGLHDKIAKTRVLKIR